MSEADEMVFRTMAAPGLEEDDVFAAMARPGEPGTLWGEGRPESFGRTEPDWSVDRAREDRHAELLRKWPPVSDGDGDDVQESSRPRPTG